MGILYNIWCVFWLVVVYLILFPFILICIQVKRWNRYATKLTNIWADIFFFISGLWVKIEHRFTPDKKESYVFVANHFSFLDIAVGMKVVRNYFSYMGKSSVKKIPLLGYMFTKLHIQVDRGDKGSRSKAMIRSSKALRSGRSLFIMPEGGILSDNIPMMKNPLKDGAFVLAIENNRPIVPITFLNLYRIMPSYKINWELPRVVVHEPIDTSSYTSTDLEILKEKVYNIIQEEIDTNRYGSRYR